MMQFGAKPTNDLAGIERVVLLQTAHLFHFCSAEEVLRIAALAREQAFATGQTIYEQGQPADALYCVVRGTVRVEKDDGESVRAGPLETFGVVEILSGRLRTAMATAETDTLLLVIDAEDFFDLLADNIEIVKAMFRQLLGER